MADSLYRDRLSIAVAIGGLFLSLVGEVRAQPFRVCVFSFHSPNELATIKARLPAPDFEFIELTPPPVLNNGDIVEPMASNATGASESGWLMSRCQPDLQCDIVIYSGEFAGGFFGQSGISLSVQEIEEASCQARCAGLFRHPQEVFLLACNTLATKGADDRTPEQYLQILLDHGFGRAAAERVVSLRYGPLGPSFRESLRRSFMGVPRIYGFSSVAPVGEITAPMLERYFARKGDYGRYLTSTAGDTRPNKELLASFAQTSLVQMTGLTALEPAFADRALVCGVYDDTQSVAERLRIVRQLFARSDFLSFVPTIEVFLRRHPSPTLRGEEQRIFKEIQAQDAARRQVLEQVHSLNVSALKMQLAHLALQLQWMSEAEFRRLADDGVRQMLTEPLTTEVVDISCELTKYVPAGSGLRSEEIPEKVFTFAEGYRMLDCLSPADPRLNARMLTGLDSSNVAIRLWTAYALSRRLPLDDGVLKALVATHVGDPSAGVRERVQWIFESQRPLSADVWATIRTRDPALAADLERLQRPVPPHG